jgi:hypothetical protein
MCHTWVMGNKKNAIPEKMEGKLKIGGKIYKVGGIKGIFSSSSSSNQKKAVRKLSKGRIFSLPFYAVNE